MAEVVYDPQEEAAAAAQGKKPSGETRSTGLLGNIDAFVRGTADMLTLGTADEIAAYMDSLTGWTGEKGDYEGNLDRQRAIDEFDKEHNPYARMAGQVTGGVAGAVAGGAPLSARATTAFLPAAGEAVTTGARVANLATRGAAGAAEGAVAGTGYGYGSGEGGVQNRAKNAVSEGVTGAAFGGLGGAVVSPLVEAGGRVVGNALTRGARAGADETVEAIAEARIEMGRLLNIDPAQISDDVARDFAQRAGQAGAAPAAAANEFNIPLTRGQATGDLAQQGFEEAARYEARGKAAGNIMREFDTGQRQAIDTATENIAKRAAGAPVGEELPTRALYDLSADTLTDIERAAAASGQRINDAYDAARASGTTVTRAAIEQAPSAIRQGVQASDVIVNDALSPYTARALQQIDEFAQLRGALTDRAATGTIDPTQVVGVSLDGVETMRKQLVQARQLASTPSDIRGMRAVINSFDDWLDDAGDSGLLHGTDEGIELFKRARAARTEHGRRFEAGRHQVDDDAGRLLQKMITKDVSEVEVANALYGAARTGEGPSSMRLAKRLKTIMGPQSPEFGRIRHAAWEKMIRNDQGELLGNQAMASAIIRATSGKGAPFVRELYNAEEIGRMRRLAMTLRQTVTDPRVTNPSKTSYGVARAVADLASGLIGGGAALAADGGPLAAAGVGGASLFVRAAARQGRGALGARRAVSGVRPQPPRPNAFQPGLAGVAPAATAIEDPEERPLFFRTGRGARQ